MKRLLIFFLLMCFGTAYANESEFAFGLTREKGVKALKGEKNIAILIQPSSAVTEELQNDATSDIKLKLQLIGLESVDFKWWEPYLLLQLSIVKTDSGIYSGRVSLSFSMPAKLDKEEVPIYSTVWEDSMIFANSSEQDLRNNIKDIMDKFLSVYLEANPRKFIDDTSDKKKSINPDDVTWDKK